MTFTLKRFLYVTISRFSSALTFSGTPVISKITYLPSSHKWIGFCPTKTKIKKAVCSCKTFPGSFQVLCSVLGLELSMLLFICISHLRVRQCPRGSHLLLDARAETLSCTFIFYCIWWGILSTAVSLPVWRISPFLTKFDTCWWSRCITELTLSLPSKCCPTLPVCLYGEGQGVWS